MNTVPRDPGASSLGCSAPTETIMPIRGEALLRFSDRNRLGGGHGDSVLTSLNQLQEK